MSEQDFDIPDFGLKFSELTDEGLEQMLARLERALDKARPYVSKLYREFAQAKSVVDDAEFRARRIRYVLSTRKEEAHD